MKTKHKYSFFLPIQSMLKIIFEVWHSAKSLDFRGVHNPKKTGRRFTVIAAHHFSVIVLFVAMTEQGEGHMRHSWRVQHKRVPARVQFHPLVGPALSSVLSFSLSHQYFNPRSGQHKRMLLPSSLCSSMRDVQQANHLLWRTRLTETAY